MTLGPMQAYDTAPVYNGQLKQGASNFPPPGLTLTAVKLHISQRDTRYHRFGAGTMVIADPTSGAFVYHWNALDTMLPGLFDVWVEATLSDGSVLSSINTETLSITNRVRGYTKFGMGRVALSAPPPQ